MTWFTGFESICRRDVPLAEHTWYKLGGPAKWFLTPQTDDQLAALIVQCRENNIPWRILGGGANVLASDSGFDGAVIALVGDEFDFISFNESIVHAGAGVDLPKLVKESTTHDLSGLERLAGIPGTVGGAIRMNAGGKYGNIGDVVGAIKVLQPDGTIATHSSVEIEFGYRRTELHGSIVLAATFLLKTTESQAAVEEYRRIWREKGETQPPMAHRSSGCIFKNPTGYSAGALIDQAGLKGMCKGGAEISTRHANFIIAHPNATAHNVLELIQIAKDRVLDMHGIELELEVDIW